MGARAMAKHGLRVGELPADGDVMTTEEYLSAGETNRVQELIYGRVSVARDSPTPRHQNLVKRLCIALDRHVEEHRLGEVWVSPLDIVLDEPRALVVQPDLFFISRERAHIVEDHVMAAPDLVIEVLSPTPRIGDIRDRVRWFAEYGVRECWLVHQIERHVAVLTLGDGQVPAQQIFGEDTPIQSSVLPDFHLTLGQIAPHRR